MCVLTSVIHNGKASLCVASQAVCGALQVAPSYSSSCSNAGQSLVLVDTWLTVAVQYTVGTPRT